MSDPDLIKHLNAERASLEAKITHTKTTRALLIRFLELHHWHATMDMEILCLTEIERLSNEILSLQDKLIPVLRQMTEALKERNRAMTGSLTERERAAERVRQQIVELSEEEDELDESVQIPDSQGHVHILGAIGGWTTEFEA